VSGRFKTPVCGRFIVEIAGSNSAKDMDVDEFCLFCIVS